MEQESSDYHSARDVYREATDKLKEIGAEKIERLMILEQWLEFEKKLDDEPNLNYVKDWGQIFLDIEVKIKVEAWARIILSLIIMTEICGIWDLDWKL